MKTKSIIYCFALAVGFLGSQTASAQGLTTTQDLTLTVDGSALISVTQGTNVGGTTVKLTLGGASEAGGAISSISENSLTRLRISSLADDATPYRKVTAIVDEATSLLNSKTKLSVELLKPTGASLENFVNCATEGGTVNGSLQIISEDEFGNTGAITLVNGIRTCWSGTGVSDGYVIHYKYEATNNGTPVKKSVTITYTIEAGSAAV